MSRGGARASGRRFCRMASKLRKQVERMGLDLEEMSKKLRAIEHCICFLSGRRPYFFYAGVQKVAFQVKCPVHGDRFEPGSEWRWQDQYRDEEHENLLREYEVGGLWRLDSENYRKAWNANFRDGGWPVEEIVIEGRTWLLPRSAEGDLIDWKNASSAPPWKRVKAYTLEDHRLAEGQPSEPSRVAKPIKRSKYTDEERRLIEEFGIPYS